MKVTRRFDSGKSGHLLISVPASRVAEVEAALAFLEAKRQQRESQMIIDLIAWCDRARIDPLCGCPAVTW